MSLNLFFSYKKLCSRLKRLVEIVVLGKLQHEHLGCAASNKQLETPWPIKLMTLFESSGFLTNRNCHCQHSANCFFCIGAALHSKRKQRHVFLSSVWTQEQLGLPWLLRSPDSSEAPRALAVNHHVRADVGFSPARSRARGSEGHFLSVNLKLGHGRMPYLVWI